MSPNFFQDVILFYLDDLLCHRINKVYFIKKKFFFVVDINIISKFENRASEIILNNEQH